MKHRFPESFSILYGQGVFWQYLEVDVIEWTDPWYYHQN